jgi:deferrochelatase/peroxidase EfeB
MSDGSGDGREPANASRRRFLTGAAGVVGAAAAARPALASPAAVSDTLPFHGPHQNGIALPMQAHAYFASFDLTATTRDQVVTLLKAWTEAAARLADGKPAQELEAELRPAVVEASARNDGSYGKADQGTAADAGETLGDPPGGAMGAQGPQAPAGDTGEAVGQSAARLTLTFGFGAGLFTKDGKDRYGLAARRPAALADLPKFVGDQIVEEKSGGDLLVQACADDPQVAFHAVRQLARIAGGAAQIRWVQTGFVPSVNASAGAGGSPRNLMGFKDGTNNPRHDDPKAMEQFVWAGAEGPDWMRGGTYMVTRRIRIALEHWDRMKVSFQEETVGRHKYSGAPIGGRQEHDPIELAAADKNGNPLIAENAHVRLATAASNDGAQILRRGYSYNDGVNFTTERWPPWRQGQEYDAGLFFVSFQRDPRTGFVKIFERMAKFDMLNQFVTHVGSGLFACPPGVAAPGPAGGEFIGQRLFE